MNQTSLGPKNSAQKPGSAPEATTGNGTPGPGNKTSPKYQAVLGPFTIRDLTIFASTLLMFIGSLLPMFGGRYNLWNLNNLFFLALGIILPLVVASLFVARRLQPGNVVRIGSLSIDQFASVVASFAVALFFLTTAGAFTLFVLVGLVGSVGLLAATVLAPHLPVLGADFKDRAEQVAHIVAREAAIPTRQPPTPKTAAPKITAAPGPAVSGPSAERQTSDALAPDPLASFRAPADVAPDAPAIAAPASEAAAVVSSVSPAGEAELPEPRHAAANTMAAPIVGSMDNGAGPATRHLGTVNHTEVNQTDREQPKVEQTIDATVDPAVRRDETEDSAKYEAFWFAVAQPRAIVDEHTGASVFTIQPGTWVLALEDRGEEFLVQDTDGKVGVLRDLSHIERG